MVWIKGQSGNPTGKSKNVKAKGTEALRRILAKAITINFKTIIEDLKGLEPKERLNVIVRLLPYVMPTAEFDLTKLTDKDLDLLIEKLREKQVKTRPVIAKIQEFAEAVNS